MHRMTPPVLGLLHEAMEHTHTVLARVTDEQRSAVTPCADYDVNGLAAHLIGGLIWFAGLPAGGTTNPTELDEPDLSGRSLVAEFAAAARQAHDAWTGQTLTTVFTIASNPVTGEGIAQFTVVELVGHSWDIATATGQPTHQWDHLARATLDLASGLDEQILRAPGMMAAPVPVAADAPPVDQLVAFLGRDPRWTADR